MKPTPKPMSVEEALEIAERPRTQYVGRLPTVAEVLAAEVRRLRKVIDVLCVKPKPARKRTKRQRR